MHFNVDVLCSMTFRTGGYSKKDCTCCKCGSNILHLKGKEVEGKNEKEDKTNPEVVSASSISYIFRLVLPSLNFFLCLCLVQYHFVVAIFLAASATCVLFFIFVFKIFCLMVISNIDGYGMWRNSHYGQKFNFFYFNTTKSKA